MDHGKHFRFSCREDYEKALSELLGDDSAQDEYEQLLDEYIEFCSDSD